MDTKSIEEQIEKTANIYAFDDDCMVVSGFAPASAKEAFIAGAKFVLKKISDVDVDKLCEILLEFYDEYDTNPINRPLIPRVYVDEIIKHIVEKIK